MNRFLRNLYRLLKSQKSPPPEFDAIFKKNIRRLLAKNMFKEKQNETGK